MKSSRMYPSCIYHTFNRGNQKQSIFFERENYLFFLRRLGQCVHKYGSLVLCYCLMPNHYHICFKEVVENGISNALSSLQTSYAKAINKRYNRTGHLWEDTFKAVAVESEESLLHLSRYIHLNPVKAGLAAKAEEWEFSSYRDIIGLRNGSLPQKQHILSSFDSPAGYRQFVEEYQDEMKIGRLLLD